MVLIFSHSGGTVNKVIDWLDSKGVKVHRINPYIDKVNVDSIEISDTGINIKLVLEDYGARINISDYTGIWIWHSNLWFENCSSETLTQETGETIEMIKTSLKDHHDVLINYLAKYLNHYNKKTIGNYNVQELNKLSVLLKAKSLGINVPNSYIISAKNQLSELLKNKMLITKPYYEVVYPIYNNIPYQNYTSAVSTESIQQADEDLFPTLVQEKIEKLFEIRSFFLCDKFYSMAIFSQESSKTQLDFRNYNRAKPSRTVPFQLPEKIEEQLKQLFKSFDLNSGSVDMIFTTKNKYVFLEINPIGQFGMVSFPCNYYLEKLVSEALINGRC